MGLWSCSSDEMLPGNTITGDAVPLAITVSRGEAQTRTIVSENNEAGLTSVWKEGDVIGLYNSNGEKAGELKLKEGEENKSTSVFEGTVTGGSGTYNLWYFGQPDADGKYPHIDFTTNAKTPQLILSTTPMTEVGQLAEYDIMSEAAEIVVSGNKAAVKEDVTMAPRMAMARFSFAGLPENQSGTLTISNNDATYTTLYKKGNIKLTEHTIGLLAHVEKDYVIENVSTDNDLYLALIPEVDYKMGFKFEVANKTYTYHFDSSTKLEAGRYYNNGLDDNGDVNGFELTFTPEEKVMAELHMYANFEGATPEMIVWKKEFGDASSVVFDIKPENLYSSYVGFDEATLPLRPGYTFMGWSTVEGKKNSVDVEAMTIYRNSKSLTEDIYAVWVKNPLYKWAEGDLVYDKLSGTSSVAASHTVRGSLYQWGRNVGFDDYVDAQGTYSKYLQNSWSYATWRQSYASGTGFIANSGNSQVSTGYTSLGVLASYKDMFYINPETGDYWDSSFDEGSSFANGGANWAERASLCGWEGEPCPTGYRLAKAADFREILPSVGGYSGSGSLASILDQTEIKDCSTNSNYKAVWRWSSVKIGSRHYLRIDARVVDQKFTTTDQINWNDKATVQTRYFGANGSIAGLYHQNILGGLGLATQYLDVVRPMPGRHVRYDEKVSTTINRKSYATVVWKKIIDLSVNNEGFYWIADKLSDQTALMYFADNTVAKNKRTFDAYGNEDAGSERPFSNMNSILTSSLEYPQSACSIRCIDTIREAE